MSYEQSDGPLVYRRNAISMGEEEAKVPGFVDIGTSRKPSPQNVKLSGTEYSRIMSISEEDSSSSVKRLLSQFDLDEQQEEEDIVRLTDPQVNGTGKEKN